MPWISEKEAGEILEVSRGTISQYRLGYTKKIAKKDYPYAPKFPKTAWRYTTKIEYDEDFILKFKAEKDGKNI